ncbi:hypothetical protein [Methanobacterium alcaliphilum]|uniref:hypothetical protein n=1 Tax=Methanobacterium alcaliphilum TaxID=392018 RepID=UPI00200AC1B8|nr:hypothetical protein [Methanobacterium alcaliphilum]MCK9151665.1 hypothetical protein [Methanobacterium alcaliphilum]
MIKNKLVIILAVFLIASVVAISGCTDNSNSQNSSAAEESSSLNVTDLKVVSQGYGTYAVKATVTPDKDYSYLEMVLIFYDSEGAVIDKSPLAWNINDVKAGQKLKVTGNGYISGSEKPAKVDVLIFDSVFSGGDESDAIYKETIEV